MEKVRLNLPIREFAESLFRGEDLDPRSFTAGRAQLGARYHKLMQQGREAGYCSEVTVSFTHESASALIVLSGRIDGLLDTDDGCIIEEVKTTYRDAGDIAAPRDAHIAQAKCYAAAYASQEGLDDITVRVTYVSIPSEEVKTFTFDYASDELIAWLTAALDAYAAKLEAQRRRSDDARASVRDMQFPYRGKRQGQRLLMKAAYDAALDGKLLLANAPTGIGKTMAALFPTLKAWGEGASEKVFYFTARNTVRQAAVAAVEYCIRAGARLRAVVLTAKEKLCPYSCSVPCTPEDCAYARGFYTRQAKAVAQLPRAGVIGEERISALSERYTICPHEFMFTVAELADCVIGDYNYAFDPRAAIKRFFDEGGEYSLLIDEAHNLVDRARGMFSEVLEEQSLVNLMKALGPKQDKPYKRTASAVRQVMSHCRRLRKRLEAEDADVMELKELDGDMVKKLNALCGRLESLLELGMSAELGDSFKDAYFPLRYFTALYEELDDTYAIISELKGRRLKLSLNCLDPSKRLAQAHSKVKSAVFFSATLLPFEYYSRLLGADDARTLDIANAFPAENFGLFVSPVDTTYKGRQGSLSALCASLCELIAQRKGNYLAYFPSYAYMRAAHELLKERDFDIVMQEQDMEESARGEFLKRFSEDNERATLGLAVMGGIFGEGIDLTGEKLIGVAVVGVGLPQLCLQRDLIRKYHDERGEDGFAFAYRIPGFNRVLQAAGRLIRTPLDRGVAVLYDSRFLSPDYLRLFPSHWSHAAKVSSDRVHEALREFWDSSG
ncbi:MAG: ATP-dependent DNA helicase [Clostridia bacterium]|nr:ATP-dependent DNA helicase [Clostridia bacterium]